MGWNKKSIWTQYGSKSGHSFLIGTWVKKVIIYQVFSKECNICKAAKRQNKKPRKYDCPENYSGYSKSIETETIFQLVIEAYNVSNYIVGTIVSDDDATM